MGSFNLSEVSSIVSPPKTQRVNKCKSNITIIHKFGGNLGKEEEKEERSDIRSPNGIVLFSEAAEDNDLVHSPPFSIPSSRISCVNMDDFKGNSKKNGT